MIDVQREREGAQVGTAVRELEWVDQSTGQSFEDATRLTILRLLQDRRCHWSDGVVSSGTSNKGVFLCRRLSLPNIVLEKMNGAEELVVVVEADEEGQVQRVRIRGMSCCGKQSCFACLPNIVAKQEYVPRTTDAFSRVLAAKGGLVLATPTARHADDLPLEQFWQELRQGYKRLHGRGGMRDLLPNVEMYGRVMAVENTHGRFGHHLHMHIGYAFSRPLRDRWEHECPGDYCSGPGMTSPDISLGMTETHMDLVRRFRKTAEAGKWRWKGRDGNRERRKLISLYWMMKEELLCNEWWDFVVAYNEAWQAIMEEEGGAERKPALLIGADLVQVYDAKDLGDVVDYLYKGDKDVADRIRGAACELTLGGVTKRAKDGGNVSMMRLAYDACCDDDPEVRRRSMLRYREWERVWNKKGRRKLALGLSQLEKALDAAGLPATEIGEPEIVVVVETEIGRIEPDVFNWGNDDDGRLTLELEAAAKDDPKRVAAWLVFIRDPKLTRIARSVFRADVLRAGLQSDRGPPSLPEFVDKVKRLPPRAR